MIRLRYTLLEVMRRRLKAKGLASLPVATSSGLPGGKTFCLDLAEGHGGKPVSCHVCWTTRAADTFWQSGSNVTLSNHSGELLMGLRIPFTVCLILLTSTSHAALEQLSKVALWAAYGGIESDGSFKCAMVTATPDGRGGQFIIEY
jgi:hypothetical protein